MAEESKPRGRPTQWVYSPRQEGNGGAITIPRVIYNQIPKGTLFRLTIVDNGILYELVTEANSEGMNIEIPWVATKKKRAPKREENA